MKGEKAVEIFELVKQQKRLPQKIDELIPLSFIGQAAVSFYRDKIKLMDQLKMTEEQRKATLKDGQDAGDMLLDIEGRIGELLPKSGDNLKTYPREKGKITKPKVRVNGSINADLSRSRRNAASAISKNPKIVEKVKAQARKNEDIPTKTAVLNEIKYEKEKERRKKAEANKTENRAIISIEQTKYIIALERCILILPQKPPEKWDENALKEATGYAKIIIKRLEVFNHG